MSDVRDVAKIHVLALENEQANGQRFIVSSDQAYSFQNLASILKQQGYDKVSTRLAPNFLVRLMGIFSAEMRGMRAFVGNQYHGDTHATEQVFNWQAIALEKTVIDTAKSVQAVLDKQA